MEKDKKEETTSKKINGKKILVIASAIVIVLAVIIGIVLVNVVNKKAGNTIANIRNFGAVAEDHEYIYFKSYTEDGLYKTINRIEKSLEKEPEQLISGDWEISGINVYGGYIYFITLEESNNSNDTVDNKIHKMKTDGTNHNVINNNEFHNNCYEMYVVKDKVYYIGADEGIYTMNLDGTDKKKIDNTSTGFIGITDKYILYNAINEEEEKNVTHIMNLDGTNDRVLTGEQLFCADIVDDTIYYTDSKGHIFKVKIGETDSTMLSSITSYCVNATSDGIYSLKYIDAELTQQAIFKMDLEGKEEVMIKRLEKTSTFLAVTEDWIVYMDETDTEAIIGMVSKDGKKYQELYSINYEEYLDNLDLTDEEVQNIVNEISNTDVQ